MTESNHIDKQFQAFDATAARHAARQTVWFGKTYYEFRVAEADFVSPLGGI